MPAAPPTPPIALVIAGHDPSGGAGLSADLRTFAALGVHAPSALTLASVQTTASFRVVRPLPGTFVRDQVDALLEDLRPVVIKIGMLPDADVAQAVARIVATGVVPHVVVDPVLATAWDRRAG